MNDVQPKSCIDLKTIILIINEKNKFKYLINILNHVFVIKLKLITIYKLSHTSENARLSRQDFLAQQINYKQHRNFFYEM